MTIRKQPYQVEYIVSGPLTEAFDLAVRLSHKHRSKYWVRRRKINSVYLTDLDGTPVWDIVRFTTSES